MSHGKLEDFRFFNSAGEEIKVLPILVSEKEAEYLHCREWIDRKIWSTISPLYNDPGPFETFRRTDAR